MRLRALFLIMTWALFSLTSATTGADELRAPAVSGTFNPDGRKELRGLIKDYLGSVSEKTVMEGSASALACMIVPHAGYVFSGEVAAHGFRPEAHRGEHSLEGQPPFLQTVLSDFRIVPLLFGERHSGGGTLRSMVYGKPCAVSVEPIEKAPLYHIMPGHRRLWFATAGCNLSCAYCQNWHISQKTVEEVDCRGMYAACAAGLRRASNGLMPLSGRRASGHLCNSTYCAACGELLVHRVQFEIVECRVETGGCPSCGATIPGIW